MFQFEEELLVPYFRHADLTSNLEMYICCHFSANAAAAIEVLMLCLAEAVNSSISAFNLLITHSSASRPCN